MRKRNLLVLLVALVGLTAGALIGATAQDATPEAETAAESAGVVRTEVRFFLPFTGDGVNPGLNVTGNESGICHAGSLADPSRPDGWSCIASSDSTLYDPCFENPFALPDEPAELVCADSPFATDVVLFATSEPLERQKDEFAGDADAMAPSDEGMSADQGPMADPAMADQAIDDTPDELPQLDHLDLLELPWAVELANGEQCIHATGATAVFAGMRLSYSCSGGGWVLGDVDVFQQVWTATHLADGGFATNLVEVTTGWY